MRPFRIPVPGREDSRGASPAVGVGLVVVVVIVVSMVTIAGVTFLSEDVSEVPPQTVIDVDKNSDGSVTIEHESGKVIPTEKLRVVGPVAEQNPFDGDTFAAGDRATVEMEESGQAVVVWESSDGDTSTVLERFEASARGSWTYLRTQLENDSDITLQNDYTPNSAGYDDEVGSGWDPVEYSGVLDGNGHEIRGLNVNKLGGFPDGYEIGFIGSLDGEVKNLDVANFTVTGARDVGFIAENFGGTVSSVTVDSATVNSTGDGGYSKAGILVGENQGTIQDSSVSGTIEGNDSSVGGLVGENKNTGTIVGSSAEGDVEGNEKVGGLVGYNAGEITDSSADGSVTGTGWHVGGLVGFNYDEITRSYATGDVSGDDYHTGGLVGENHGNITKSYASGDVDGKNAVGGLVGGNSNSWAPEIVRVTDSYALGDVDGSGEYVGGLAGYNRGQLKQSFAVGDVDGAEEVGGITGHNNDRGINPATTGIVSNSYWNTNTTGQSSSDGGTGLTTADMTGNGALNNMFGSNSVWDTTGDYPVLQALDEQTQLEARD